MRKIPFLLSAKLSLAILLTVIVFHVFVLIGFVPPEIVWGGRIETRNELIVFELISISINLIVVASVISKSKIVKPIFRPYLTHIILWIFVVLFALNTVGNLFSLNSMETIIFTPLTLLLSILMFRLAIEKN